MSSCFQFGGSWLQPLHPPHPHRHAMRSTLPRLTRRSCTPSSRLWGRTLRRLRPRLGVRTVFSPTVLLRTLSVLLLTQTGPPQKPKGISLLAVSETVRAWTGGPGADKRGLNYAPGSSPSRTRSRRGTTRSSSCLARRGRMARKRSGLRRWGGYECVCGCEEGRWRSRRLHVPTRRHDPARVHARLSPSGALLEVFGVGTAVVVARGEDRVPKGLTQASVITKVITKAGKKRPRRTSSSPPTISRAQMG